MNAKHTPGPWDDASNYPQYESVRIFADTHYIATVGNSDDPKALTEANARLITAAPDYHAAVELVEKDATEMLGDNAGYVAITRESWIALKAAQAKADGR